MENAKRVILLGSVITMLGLTTHAMAEWGESCEHGPKARGERMEQMHERRQTLLHDSLQLTPEQEKAWTTFVAKEKELRPKNRPEPQELESLNAPQRMEKMLERLHEHEDHLTKMLGALKEFYAVLTPKQKKIFDEFMPAHGHGERKRGPH